MRWILAAALGLIAGTAIAEGWHEPARGSAERAALMDAIRPHAEWQLGAPVEFVVHDLRVAGPLGFASLYAQRPGGAAIDLYQTPAFRRGSLSPEEIDGASLQALYWRSGNTWVAVHWVIGATDVWWAEPELCSVWRAVTPEACQGL